ncbi:MAG: helix-turn-helix domain-containing protein [Thermodesulfobacteriota bacterium]|nr:helix-turn-helix domain-containing protein [Thermodesulfobacteriota bacterium]
MKRIEEQTYYEILEVNPDATVKEIQGAYEHARETFHADSLAVYSLFLEEERVEVQKAIEEAYRVLMDETLRRSYDQSHSLIIEKSSREKQANAPLRSPEKKGNLSFSDLSLDLGEVTYRGRALKQIRERLGIDLKTIASETKINMKTLEWIEEEDLDHLPAMVYLKGFLKAYAQALHLDPRKLIEGYLQLFKEQKKR